MANPTGHQKCGDSPTDILSFTWSIENFQDMQNSRTSYRTLVKQHHTSVKTGRDNHTWDVNLMANDRHWVGVECRATGDCHTPLVKLQVIIPSSRCKNSSKNFFDSQTDTKQLTVQDNVIKMDYVVYLIEFKSRIPITSNGSLTIIINLWTYTTLAEIQTRAAKQFLKDITGNVSRCGGRRDSSDFKIVTGDGKEFLVHKQVLSARSQVFAAMLQYNFNERKTGLVRIPDVTSHIMDIILEYVYTGNMNPFIMLEPSDLIDLAYASEKYALDYLLKFCDVALAEKCNKDNAAKLFTMSKNLPLIKTKSVCVHCMKVKLREVSDEEDLVYLLEKLETKRINRG